MTGRILSVVGMFITAVLGAQTAADPAPLLIEEETQETVTAPVARAIEQPAMDPEEFRKLQEELKAKEVLVERLSKHLESALKRINQTHSPDLAENTTMAAVVMQKEQLERQNAQLKARQIELQEQLVETSKKAQLLDLESRQLYAAFSGRSAPAENQFKGTNQISGKLARQP